MHRRQFLDQLSRRAAALALGSLFAAPAWRPLARAATVTPGPQDPFTLGIASGMPRPDSIVLWTRLAPRPQEPGAGLAPQPIAVRWELAEDERFSRGVRSGEVVALPEHAHSVHVEVRGLAPAAGFFYRFIAGDHSSPTGRTRTAPAQDARVERLRLALASCQHYEQGAYVAHREIAARELDAVLFVGDYIYESSNPRLRLRPHEGPAPLTLDQYRARHATYKGDADLRAAHAAHPWVVTWDDHEVENDYAGDHSPSGLDVPAFLNRRAAAYKAYFEHMPVSPSMAPAGPAMRIHDRFVWGRLAEWWTLDNRQFRDVQACPDARGAGGRVLTGCDELEAASRSIWGAAQERWLKDGLAASRRRWKLLAQGTQICPAGIDTPHGRRIFSDGWDGYPQARERLLRSIADARLADVLCLGGDVHRHVAANLRVHGNDERSPVVASEFVCGSVTSRGTTEATMAAIRRDNPDIVHGRGDEHGYALLEITPQSATCDFRGTPFPVAPDATLHSQGKFAVESGRAGVVAMRGTTP
ncbi:MAG TPA: alkaline phosphatase D family protein [Albitalea sp.]|nr:alkaline phosphatase D family protein [Albitalea sp.]